MAIPRLSTFKKVNNTVIELYYKQVTKHFFNVPIEKFDVKFDVTVFDVQVSMLLFSKFDVPVFDVNIIPQTNFN